MLLHHLSRYRDVGLLLVRVGLGITFMFFHGSQKLFGGPEVWRSLGERAAAVGIEFLPVFWGFMAGFAEFVGGLCLLLGLFFRPALFLLIATMTVAAAAHTSGMIGGSPLHAIELGIVFLALVLIGPGRYSLDARLAGRRRRGF